MRKRTTRSRARPKTSKKGLTLKEKTQVKAIAKRAVNSMAESKYFNVAKGLGELGFASAWRTSGGVQSEIGVLGFTTGERKDVNNIGAKETWYYGVEPQNGNAVKMESLECNRIYTSDQDQSSDKPQYQIEGHTIRPSYCETSWLLNRLAGDTEQEADLANGFLDRFRSKL